MEEHLFFSKQNHNCFHKRGMQCTFPGLVLPELHRWASHRSYQMESSCLFSAAFQSQGILCSRCYPCLKVYNRNRTPDIDSFEYLFSMFYDLTFFPKKFFDEKFTDYITKTEYDRLYIATVTSIFVE